MLLFSFIRSFLNYQNGPLYFVLLSYLCGSPSVIFFNIVHHTSVFHFSIVSVFILIFFLHFFLRFNLRTTLTFLYVSFFIFLCVYVWDIHSDIKFETLVNLHPIFFYVWWQPSPVVSICPNSTPYNFPLSLVKDDPKKFLIKQETEMALRLGKDRNKPAE